MSETTEACVLVLPAWSAQPTSPKELRLSKSGSNSSTRAGYAAATNT